MTFFFKTQVSVIAVLVEQKSIKSVKFMKVNVSVRVAKCKDYISASRIKIARVRKNHRSIASFNRLQLGKILTNDMTKTVFSFQYLCRSKAVYTNIQTYSIIVKSLNKKSEIMLCFAYFTKLTKKEEIDNL